MNSPNVPLNIPQRKSKQCFDLFGCITAPFYVCNDAAREGAPVTLASGSGSVIEVATPGSASTGIIGLIAQEVYDASTLGALSGYDFLNETKAKTGDTVGVITGMGYVMTKNYTGSVAIGDNLYPAASGYLSASRTGSDMSVGVAEEAGTDGATYIRVRVNFNLV